MSYGAWGKQVAVRFEPHELELLDRLVAAKKGPKNDYGYYGYESYSVCRSSVIRGLVRDAAAAAAKKPAAKKPAEKKAKKKSKGRP